MKNNLVHQIPLGSLMDSRGQVTTQRTKELGEDDIKNLLREGPVQFVVANVGDVLIWIPVHARFEFWKNEVRSHLADSATIYLGDFPDEYAYRASLWQGSEYVPLVLLEKYH